MMFFIGLVAGILLGWFFTVLANANAIKESSECMERAKVERAGAEELYKDTMVKAHEIKLILEESKIDEIPLSEEGVLRIASLVYSKNN